MTKFSVATAVMLVGGLAVVEIPAATTTAYADATTCASFQPFFEQCETVGKTLNPVLLSWAVLHAHQGKTKTEIREGRLDSCTEIAPRGFLNVV